MLQNLFAKVGYSAQKIVYIWLIPVAMAVALLVSGPSLVSVAGGNVFGLQVARAEIIGRDVTLRLDDVCTRKAASGSWLPEAPALPAQTAYLAGLQSLTRGDWSLAGTEFGEAGRGDLSKYQQGWSLWCAGDRAAAITTWGRDGEAVAGFFFLLAENRYAASLFQEARSWINLSLSVNQRFAPSLLLRGKLDESDGNWTEALVSYQSAADADPGNAKAQFCAGNAEYQIGDWEKAEAYLSQAVQLSPHTSAYRYLYGCALSKLALWNEAEQQFREAILRDPSHCWSQTGLVNALIKQGKLPEADLAMTRAVQSCEDSEVVAYYYSLLAVAALESNDVPQAIGYYECAVTYAPHSQGYRAALTELCNRESILCLEGCSRR